MAENNYNRLHLNIEMIMEIFSPDADMVISTVAGDKFDTFESVNLTSPNSQIVNLARDAVDIEVIPASLSGIKFMAIRVLKKNLASVPDIGTLTVKITSAVGNEQIVQGDWIVIRNKDADITSIKLTNNEDSGEGVTLPVLVILGGI